MVGKMQMRISNINGMVTPFYRLHTRKLKRLNCTIESYYYDLKNTTTILFQFSPKAIDHDVWDKFEEVKLRENVCEN